MKSVSQLAANVIVTDNELSPAKTNSAYSSTFTVSRPRLQTSLTPSSSAIILGQGVTFSVTIQAATGPFLLKLTASNGVVANTVKRGTGTVTFGTIFPQFNPSIYNVIGTDTGTTNPFTFSSAQNSVVVNNAPTTISSTTVSTTTINSTSSSSICGIHISRNNHRLAAGRRG